MTTVEKRRSSRKSHRKRNDGGYSDTETDREVSSLTDRAFRSLCIGDEAVYNDSDLSASPCAQRGRQLAISHNAQEREDRERQELKRTAHESFSLRVQQYGQDWNYRGMYGAAIHKDQQWGVCGERGTQGRLSATFQQSFVEAPQQECPSRELSLYSNGTAEVSSQPHRSRSRVSSLVQAFNSEGQRDEAVYNNETSWDKSALMSIERELSEFSSYPQNMNSGYFPSAGLFSSQNYYSSEMAAISQMNSASSFMRSSHSMSTQVNCNSNFFIHSEFSPFKVWRDQNRFPFHGGQVSGFVPCSEFQKWYETPMYKELSLQPQQHPSMFSDQGYHRNTFAPAVPMNPQRSTSASSMMQRASAVEKRCESAGHYRKRAQSTGANRLAPQRPSTASPSGEMSRQVRDTISSVKSLQQRIKMMAEQNLETQSQGGFYNSNYLSPYGPMVPNMVSSNPYAAPYQMQKSPVYAPQEPQQFLQPHSSPPVEHAPVRAESRGATPDIKTSSYKSRAASLLYNLKDNRKRVKATYSPSKFKSMDTQEKYKQEPKDFVIDVPEFPGNELLNSTDERLEVGQYGYQNSQYTQNSQPEFESSIDRNRLNIPQFGYQGHNPGMLQYPQNAQYPQPEFVNPTNKSISLNVPQYGYQARSPGMLRNSQHMENSQHKFVNLPEDRGNRLEAGPYGYQAHSPRMLQNAQFPQNSQHMPNSQQLYPGQNPSEYYRAQMHREMAPHHGFTGYTPEHYANNKLANGQNPYENISSFAPYTQGMSDTGEGDYVNRLGQNAAAEMQRFSALGQSRDYVSKDNSRQQFNEAASGEFTGVDRYNQRKENKYDYNNVYSQDMWGQTNSQEIQRPGIPLAQNYQNINAYQRTNALDNVQSYNYEHKLIENYGGRPHGAVACTVSNQGPQYPPPHPANAGNPGYAQHNTQLPGTYRDIYAPQTSHECNKENKMKENYAPQDNHKYYDQESKKQTIISSQGGVPIATEELGQRKETVIKDNGMKGMQLKETGHFENSKQEEKAEQEQVEEMSTRDQGTNEKVFLPHKVLKDKLNEINIAEDRPKVKPYQHKEEFEGDMFAKYRSDKDLPIAEKQIKHLREEKSSSAPAELQEVTDEQGHVVETKLERLDTEQQLRVRHTNTEELKEEAIKCELAASSEEARIEQVKPEPSRKERVITDRANETQVGAQHVERKIGEERSEAKQAVTEQITENTKSEEKNKKEVVKDETSIIEIQTSKQEKNYNDVIDTNVINEPPVSISQNTEKAKKDATNVNDAQKPLSKSEPKQPVICELDKVEQRNAEFVKSRAELKENMTGEPKVHKDEEHFDQVNGNSLLSSKEPQVAHKGLDHANRGADDYERIREKYGYNQAADKNKTTITGSEQPTLPNTNKKDEIIENTVDSNLDSKKESTNSEIVSDATDIEKAENTLYDDSTESQYVYSESSKDFKLSVASDVPSDAPMEKAEKSDDSQQRNYVKHVLDDERKLSNSNLPDSTDKGRVAKNDASHVRDVLVDKVDKVDISQHKDAKQAVVERKQKSSDQSTGSCKETSLKGLTLKDKAQTKHEILASKIKAHAEKEISAIKEGFAIRDGFKNPTKPLAMSQNVNIRQKPPSQEVYKKQERALNGDTSKVQSPSVTKTVTATGQQQVQAATETSVSKTIKIAEKPSTQKDKKVRCSSPTDDKSKHQDKPSKQHKLDKEDNTELPENTEPSLQLVFGQSSAQNDTLKIMGIMVTVRERQPLESKGDENKGIQELSAKCPDTETNTGVESNINRLSEKAIAPQATEEHDYNESKNIKSEMDSTTALESTEKNLIDCTTAKTTQQGSSLPIDRPQSETQRSNHLAEKVVSPAVTVPTKNKVLAATQPVPNKQDIISEETKEYANRASNPARVIIDTKDQEDITGIRTKQDLDSTIDINRVTSVPSTSKNEETQRDNLHIDSIAIRVVPAVTEEVITTGIISSGSVTAKEITGIVSNHHQESSPSNDDVQKVLSSVRKQAQLLKNSNQQTTNNTTSKNIENDQSKEVINTLDEITRPPMEEGYFQVEKRNNEPQNNISVGQTPKAVSQERECFKSLSNSETGSNQSLKEESHTEIQKSSSANMHDLNTKTSKHTGNPSNDESNKDEKQGIGRSHQTRRHHMAKDRQRSLSNTQDGTDRKVEVTSKPKVPMPEISALADYARLKVIVSKDNEDNLQELPPNKKEGFFPLIQSRHSKRPVFTVDSQEDLVKEKPSQNQSDASIKVNKEPKPVVFPITEKKHRRTGMFKLGDKETKGTTDNSNTGVQKIQDNVKEQTTQDKTNKVHHTEKKVKHMLEKSRATLAQEEKKATQREEEQRAREREAITAQIRERRMKQREPERQEDSKNKVAEQQLSELDEPQKKTQTEEQKLLEEQQKRSSLTEERKSTQEENPWKAQEDHQLKAPITEEQLNRDIIEKQQRKAEEQKKKDISEDQQRVSAQIELQKKSFFLEQQRRAALEEQEKRTAQIQGQKAKAAKEEHLKKAVLEEHTRKATEEHLRKAEENNRAILEEKQKKAAPIGEQRQWLQDEQQKRAAQEEQLRKKAEEERQKKAEEQKKRAALEEQQRKAAVEEQLKMSALAEQQRRTSMADEQQRKAVLTEEQRRQAAHEEHTRKREEQPRRFTLEEQQRKAVQEEQKKKAALEEQQRKMAEEDQKRKAAIIEEQNKRGALEEQHRKAAAEEQRRKAALIEEQKRKFAADEQRKAALKEQQRRVAEEEQQRKAAEEQKRQAALIEEKTRQAVHEEQLRKMQEEEQQRKAAIIEQQKKRAALEEEHKKAALIEEQRRAALEEQQRKNKMIEEEQKQKAAIEEEQRKAAEEQQRKAALIEEKRRQAVHEEQLRKMEEEEQQRKAAIIEQQKKKAALEEEHRRKAAEEQRKAAEEQQRKAALIEEKRRQAAHEEQLRKMEEEEHQRKAAIIEEQKKRAALEEQQRRFALEEQQRKTAQEQQKQKAALEEQQRKMAEEEQQRKAMQIEEEKKINALEEQQRKIKLAEEEQQRKAATEEQRRQAATIEEQRRQAAHKEQLRKMAEEKQQREAAITEEQKKRVLIEEQQRRLALEEQQRKAAQEEQRQKAALEEQQRKAALIEEKRRQAAHEEHLRKMEEEEHQRKAAIIEEQKKKAALEEEQRRKAAIEEEQRKAEEEQQRKAALIDEQKRQAAHEEQLRQMALKEQQRKNAIIEEQKKRAAFEEQQRQFALEEQQRKTAQEQQKQKAALEEQQRKMAEEEQQRKAMQIEEQKKIDALEEQQRKIKLAEEEQQRKAAIDEQRKVAEEQRKAAIIEEQRRQAAHKEQLRKMAEEELQRKAAITEEQKKRVLIEEQQRRLALEEQQRKAAQEEQKVALAEQQQAAQKQQQRQMAEEERQRKVVLEEQHRKAAVIEEQKRRAALEEEQQRITAAAIEEQKRKAVMIEKQNRTRQEEDETRLSVIREERIRRQIEEAREAQIEQERKRQKDQQKTEQRVFREQDMGTRAGQAETAEREEQKNTSEKTEALQYYSLTSAKVEKLSPPQKRNSTIEPETAEDSRRLLAPVSPAPSLPRSSASSPAFGTKPSMFKVKDNTVRGSSLTKSIKPRFHKNFGEEFRVGSPMERAMEKNEEDQGVLRYNAGTPVYPEKSPSTPLPEYRPFSRRSLALDEEDCRSVISNMSDVESFATSAADLADIRALYDSDRPESACSFSSDVSRLGKPPVVPPKSEKALRRAKRLATRRTKKELTKGVTENSSETSMSEVANADAVASPHFAPPISIAHAPPAGSSVPSSHSHQHSFQATPHATAPVSLPTASPHTSAPVSVPLSQHAGSFSTPKSIPQVPSSPTHHNAPKPVTQYQVESGFPQSYTQRRVMQDVGSGQYYVVDVPVEVKTKTFFDPETGKYVQLNVRESNRNATQRQPLQAYPQSHLKPKIHAKPQPTPSANAHYQGYHSYPKGYQSGPTSSPAPVYQSVTPETIPQDKQPVRSNMTHQDGGNDKEYSYIPDKTPYMDTVKPTDKARNVVYSTHGSQRAQSEGDGHVSNSRRGSRDIITMSELEDFMEASDW